MDLGFEGAALRRSWGYGIFGGQKFHACTGWREVPRVSEFPLYSMVLLGGSREYVGIMKKEEMETIGDT